MTIEVRSENVADYAVIAEVNILAFGRGDEATLVAATRCDRRFDPLLSLVAVESGCVVGHSLFVIYDMLVAGEPVRGASLAPLAVHPDYQRQGIGTRLLHESHRMLSARGVDFAFLLGHSSYYPRVGYRTNTFGAAQVRVKRQDLPTAVAPDAFRPLRNEDCAALMPLWRQWYGRSDLAIVPAASVLDWMSPAADGDSIVHVRDGEVVGYARFRARTAEVYAFMAADREATGDLLAYLGQETASGKAELVITLHPDAPAVRELMPLPYEGHLEAWVAGMIKVLNPECRSIVDYVEDVTQGRRQPGLLAWPVFFEVVV